MQPPVQDQKRPFIHHHGPRPPCNPMANLASMAFSQPPHGIMMPNQRFLHQQAQMAHPMLSTLAGQAMPPQLAAGQMFPFFSQCNINPLLLQRNLALNQAPPHQQHFMKKEGVSQSPSSPPRSPASLSAHSTEDGMETPRTQSPDSSHSQTTPTGSKKLSQPMQPSSLSSQNSMNTIFPRRKAGQHARLNSKP
eukprot:2876331-Rhodomonas_salina.1